MLIKLDWGPSSAAARVAWLIWQRAACNIVVSPTGAALHTRTYIHACVCVCVCPVGPLFIFSELAVMWRYEQSFLQRALTAQQNILTMWQKHSGNQSAKCNCCSSLPLLLPLSLLDRSPSSSFASPCTAGSLSHLRDWRCCALATRLHWAIGLLSQKSNSTSSLGFDLPHSSSLPPPSPGTSWRRGIWHLAFVWLS